MIRLLLILFLLQINSSFASAQSLDDAFSAQHRGDFELADRIFRRLADNGDEEAQIRFALFLIYEKNTEFEYALELLNAAATNGNLEAARWLAILYSGKTTSSIDADYSKVVKWERIRAESGDMTAQESLAYFFKKGLGVEEDPSESTMWYMMAANQGSRSAQYELGNNFRYGYGVQRNYVEAVNWYKQAAKGPHGFAIAALAELYESGGFGLSRNYLKSYQYHHIICKMDWIVGTCADQERVAKKMSAADILRAERSAVTCIETDFKECD